MGIPVIQQYRIGRYIFNKKVRRIKRYPLVLMLEPLFQCNLACSGCGKINYPQDILDRRLSTAECLAAVDECGAPVVSIAGGEPLLHKEMPQIVEGIIQRRKFVYLCTNAVLLKKSISAYVPSPYLTFSVHLDGMREHHDASVSRPGVFDVAVEAIRIARNSDFRVTTNCTVYNGLSVEGLSEFFDFATGLGVEGITVSPGFDYESAPQHRIFLKRTASKQFFREIFNSANGRMWNFNHTSLYLDFLAGNRTYQCTPWGNPTRNVLGWQRPCYLLLDEGYAPSFKSLLEDTAWENYGLGRNPKCSNCMLHSGFEATAVNDMVAHPLKTLNLLRSGPRTKGPMAHDLAMKSPEPFPESREKIAG